MPNKYEKYYRILDLDVGASKEDVKKAFRELSHIWHPDNHMGKSSNVQNRATEKFKEISNAYQVLNDYLRAEEKKKAEQAEREREGKERKQREENERRKREEESRSKAEQDRRGREEKEREQREESLRRIREEIIRGNAEQDRREREEKEHKYWEEQAKNKHEKEKNKQKNTEQLFVTCPECKEEIKASSTIKLRVICKSCGHIFHYFFEGDEIRIVSEDNGSSEKNESAISQNDVFMWGRDFWSWAWPFGLIIFIAMCSTFTNDDKENSRAVVQKAKEKTTRTDKGISNDLSSKNSKFDSLNTNSAKPISFSWKRTYKGIISGKQGLTMHLQRNGNELAGTYVDIHEMNEKKLRGHFLEEMEVGSFMLGEFIDFKRIGTFLGKYTSEKTIEGEWISQDDPKDKFSFKLEEIEEQSTTQQDEPVEVIKPKAMAIINAVSEKDMLMLLKNGQQPCGEYLLDYGEGEDEDYLKEYPDQPKSIYNHKEFVTISDKHGITRNEIKGLGITQVICTDINNDQTLDLFIEVFKGGNSIGSFSGFVYSLGSKVEKIFQYSTKTQGIKDLNGDGYKEIVSNYNLSFLGGLCHACSPYPPLVVCAKGSISQDCTRQFPDFLLEKFAQVKHKLQLELEHPRIKSDPINVLGGEAIEVLVLGRMLGQEKQALSYLKRYLPSKVYKWMEVEKEKLILSMTLEVDSLAGQWKVTEFLGAGGIYSGGAEKDALKAIGKVVTINTKKVQLYDGQTCTITSKRQEELDNSGFGSAGGSWARLGLKPIPSKDGHYLVNKFNLQCENLDTRVIMTANNGALVLLNVWETWVKLAELSPPQ